MILSLDGGDTAWERKPVCSVQVAVIPWERLGGADRFAGLRDAMSVGQNCNAGFGSVVSLESGFGNALTNEEDFERVCWLRVNRQSCQL